MYPAAAAPVFGWRYGFVFLESFHEIFFVFESCAARDFGYMHVSVNQQLFRFVKLDRIYKPADCFTMHAFENLCQIIVAVFKIFRDIPRLNALSGVQTDPFRDPSRKFLPLVTAKAIFIYVGFNTVLGQLA